MEIAVSSTLSNDVYFPRNKYMCRTYHFIKISLLIELAIMSDQRPFHRFEDKGQSNKRKYSLFGNCYIEAMVIII